MAEKVTKGVTAVFEMTSKDASAALEEEFEAWSRDGKNDKIFLIESVTLDDHRVQIKLLLDLYEVKLYVPAGYPDYELGSNFHIEAPSAICMWCNAVNEYLLDMVQARIHLKDILDRIIFTYCLKSKKESCNTTSLSSEEELSEDELDALDCDIYADDAPSDEENISVSDWELNVGRLKSRWRNKEAEIHQELFAKDNTPNGGSRRQIFSFSSGVLSNDLMDIMKHEQETGICVTAVDDNVFKWCVKFSKFDENTVLSRDLKELEKVYNYNYVEVYLEFVMDLYPFYPPLLKIIRPRMKGILKMESLSSFDFVPLFGLSHWNPAGNMRNLLDKLKTFFQETFTVDLQSSKNDPVGRPQGPYDELEHSLLKLNIVSEIKPSLRFQDSPMEPYVGSSIFEDDLAVEMTQYHPLLPQKESNGKECWLTRKDDGEGECKDVRMPGWAAHAAALKEKSKQVEMVLGDISNELKTSLFHDQLYPVNEHTLSSSSSSSSTNGSSTTVASFTSQQGNSVAQLIQESSLIPFLEKHLNVDSFVVISRNLTLYKLITAIFREIVTHKQLRELIIEYSDQKCSLYSLLKNITQKSNLIEGHSEVSANGCIPGMSTGNLTNGHSPTESPPATTKNIHSHIADQKLAREFSDLLKLATEYLKDDGLISMSSSLEDDDDDDDDDDGTMELQPCLPSTSQDEETYRKCASSLQAWNTED